MPLIFFFTWPVAIVFYFSRIQGLAGFGLAIVHLTATYLTTFYGWYFAQVFFSVNQL